MTKLAVFALIIVNLLPISASKKANFENSLKSKYSFQTAEAKKEETKEKEKLSIVPEKKKGVTDVTRAKGQIAVDMSTGTVLEEQNAEAKLQIASLTKLMTAYVSLNDLSLNKEVTVANFNLQSGDATMGIQPGETLAFHSLLKGLLINSGSDAAQAIAIADAGSVDAFVAKMNKATTDLGLKNTHFSNPVGWDDGNNYSSARDMAGLARVMLNNQTVRKIVKSPYDSVTTSGGRSINLANTDILLADPNYIGVKTGYTPGAGECLISLNVGTGREILTVVIGSGDRFGQTRAFFDWLNANFMLK